MNPPNWYPDPGQPDQLRYWDGQAWTEHTRLLGTEAASKPSYGERYRSRWRWTCLVVGGLFVASSFASSQAPDFSTSVNTSASVIDLVLRFVLGGFVFGTIANLLVAVPSGASSTTPDPPR